MSCSLQRKPSCLLDQLRADASPPEQCALLTSNRKNVAIRSWHTEYPPTSKPEAKSGESELRDLQTHQKTYARDLFVSQTRVPPILRLLLERSASESHIAQTGVA